MAAKKFSIPSISDMDSSKKEEYKVKTLFDRHKSSTKAGLGSSKSDASNQQTAAASSGKHSDSVISSIDGAPHRKHPTTESGPQLDAKVQKMDADSKKSVSNQGTISNSQNVPKDSSRIIKPVNTTSSGHVTGSKAASSGHVTGSKFGISGHVTSGLSPMRAPKTNCLLVNNRQRGNPLLKHIRSVPWEYADIVPDYEMGTVRCALFLSIRYHNLNPNYIHERLKLLGRSYDLRVLLVQIDVSDPHHVLKDLAKMCILVDCTMLCAWSPEEAARYLETYKAFEIKPPDMIMEKQERDFIGRIQEVLTSARKVNRTDAVTLLKTFGTMENIINSSKDELSFCPGFGPQKARKLYSVLNEPFLKRNKRDKLKQVVKD